MTYFSLFNSKTRQKERIEIKKTLSMYVCGPTVYDHLHIGNLRPAITFDLLRNACEGIGVSVQFVSNITDIDDKIIQRAKEQGKTEEALTLFYTNAYETLLETLGIQHTARPKVTEYMDEIISYIEQLVKAGYAYEQEGNVFFDVEKYASMYPYGIFKNQSIDQLRVGARVEEDVRKNHPADFALWKKTDEGITFTSSFGKGRPGWHTECVAMIQSFFGKYVDIHGGGSDLKFPHHENEEAQACACHQHELARCWMHNGMIRIGDEKMSKSLGNVLLAKDFLENYGNNVTRLWLYQSHYRKDVALTEEALATAKKLNQRIQRFLNDEALENPITYDRTNSYVLPFQEALANDLSSSNALSYFQEILKDFYEMEEGSKHKESIKDALLHMIRVFNLQREKDEEVNDTLSNEEQELFDARNAAKQMKNYKEADIYRTELEKRGIEIIDSREGTRWKRV